MDLESQPVTKGRLAVVLGSESEGSPAPTWDQVAPGTCLRVAQAGRGPFGRFRVQVTETLT